MPDLLCKLFIFLTVHCLSACASQKEDQVSAEYLKPAGWLESNDVLLFDSFKEYAEAVRQKLVDHRIPLDPGRSELEIDAAAPKELMPEEKCGKQIAGIALLVHGLSDTAFAMHDLAEFLAAECFIARTVLLPGHGTRSGDLLVVDHQDWLDTVRALSAQAADEHDNILLVGFSLGAVLTLSIAMETDSPVDAVMAFSPAYALSMYRLAKHATWLHRLYPWIDKDLADDYVRYEAMPTKGVAETVRSMKRLHKQLAKQKRVSIPWLVVQSMDDAATVPLKTLELFQQFADSPHSKLISFYSEAEDKTTDSSVVWIEAGDPEMRVQGLTHLAVHISPDNPHYGLHGDYINCGIAGGRPKQDAIACQQAEQPWYGLWSKPSPPGVVSARSTFNPQFDFLKKQLSVFINNYMGEL